MSKSTGPETPLQEAVSIITIISIMSSVGCYVAALNQIPCHYARAYEFLPALASLPDVHLPILPASAAAVKEAPMTTSELSPECLITIR
jgi:hypothetical protein